MDTSDWIALGALTVALFSALFSFIQWRRTSQEALVKALQGDKAAIAFAADWVANNGLPRKRAYRSQLLNALCLAAVFESSDRARAWVYGALRRYRDEYHWELEEKLNAIEETFGGSEDILDLKRGVNRLTQLREALKMETPQPSGGGAAVRK